MGTPKNQRLFGDPGPDVRVFSCAGFQFRGGSFYIIERTNLIKREVMGVKIISVIL